MLVSIFVLQACDKTAQLKQDQENVKAAVYVYENQLIKNEQPYAVISGQPRSVDMVLVRSPYVIQSIDGNKLARPEYSFDKARPLPRDLAFSALKIPAGRHDIVVYGGYSNSKATTFKDVNLKAGGKYVVVESKTNDKSVKIFIAEYTEDPIFTRDEAEFYIVGKAVTPIADLGGQVNALKDY